MYFVNAAVRIIYKLPFGFDINTYFYYFHLNQKYISIFIIPFLSDLLKGPILQNIKLTGFSLSIIISIIYPHKIDTEKIWHFLINHETLANVYMLNVL